MTKEKGRLSPVNCDRELAKAEVAALDGVASPRHDALSFNRSLRRSDARPAPVQHLGEDKSNPDIPCYLNRLLF